MNVHVGRYTFDAVLPEGDKSSFEALEAAKTLHASGAHFTSAVVDRFDGLVLLAGPIASETQGRYFRNALCGYEGTGPRATAQILEMFGFGNPSTIYKELMRGKFHAFTR